MGSLGIGIMNSMAFLPLANNNPQVDKIQIPFGTVDFQPHQSSFAQVFESMDQDMDLTIGSLNFHIGSLGLIRLLDLTKPDPSASEPEIVAISESSECSSSEVNLEVQLKDLMICHDNTSDQSTDTWKIGLELSEDDNSILSSYNSKLDNRYQILTITGDNSEELSENNNPVLNPANINIGANHLAEGETADSLATREKVRLSVDKWRTIKIAIEHSTPIPTNSSKNMLLGYHYTLRQQAKQLAKERIEI
jgi:hypothetical protein